MTTALVLGGIIAALLSTKKKSISGVGLVGDRTFDYRPTDEPFIIHIYANEPYFGKKVWVATMDVKNETIKPTHGYYYPHKYGKMLVKVAQQTGYDFIQDGRVLS